MNPLIKIFFPEEEEDENMEDWDEDKLAEVVSKKHGAEKSTQTDIICKYFLDAVENNKYGWFWECPDKEIVAVSSYRQFMNLLTVGFLNNHCFGYM